MQKLALALCAAFLCACSNAPLTAPRQKAPPTGIPPVLNGRTIFMTGKDSAGFQIMAASAPMRTSCAACHRTNGSGGVHLPGGAVSADLRRTALSAGTHPYTLRLLERAISLGIDNEGKPLNRVMPRWTMTPRDLHDVALFVQTLR